MLHYLREKLKECFRGLAKSKVAGCVRLTFNAFSDPETDSQILAEDEVGRAFLRLTRASRLGASDPISHVQASDPLGSDTSMETAETVAVAEQEPRPLPEDGEQAREAAAPVERILEQESEVETIQTAEDELRMVTPEDSAFMLSGLHLPKQAPVFGNGQTLADQKQQAAMAAAAAAAPVQISTMQQGFFGPEMQVPEPLAPALLSHVQSIPMSVVTRLGRLGSGAFSTVWLGHTSAFGTVAVKSVKEESSDSEEEDEEEEEERPSLPFPPAFFFVREANLLASFDHPNIVRAHGVVVADVAAGLESSGSGGSSADWQVAGVMIEHMPGGSLSDALEDLDEIREQLPMERIPLRLRAELALHAVRGVAYLHDVGVLHLDLKPGNLLLAGPLDALHPDQPAPIVKVADFGMAEHKDRVSIEWRLMGTLPYMAPELAFADSPPVTEKADVWSMGVVLWEMLTLTEPYADEKSIDIEEGLRAFRKPEIPKNCEPEWASLMRRCWKKNPEKRCSLRELGESLQRIIDGQPKQ